MKKKIPVKILGLSYSQSNIGSYVLVLSEINGRRKIPIIIRPNEAQYVAIKLESVKSSSPLTYDLFKSMTDAMDCHVTEVSIEGLVEGIFYCSLKIKGDSVPVRHIPSAVGDAVSLSLAYGCPMYVSKEVMELAGVVMGDDGEVEDEAQDNAGDGLSSLSVEGLEKMLAEAIEDEEYELASQLRDKISLLRSKAEE
jgi:bifunctional DNase/RNase